ncbi:hypothetical protein AVEN_76368-1 [Araneus ventricosus]|uniref:Uncharacterized protein n=1 Tax=Araneus ventricosus TaxID=182803 RepID=A0A4Y2KL73_ARAVE|nr:hypothetical protein AVEN_76368-1 [Araneus ventricosus]
MLERLVRSMPHFEAIQEILCDKHNSEPWFDDKENYTSTPNYHVVCKLGICSEIRSSNSPVRKQGSCHNTLNIVQPTDSEISTFGRFYTRKGCRAMSYIIAFPEFFVRSRSVKCKHHPPILHFPPILMKITPPGACAIARRVSDSVAKQY